MCPQSLSAVVEGGGIPQEERWGGTVGTLRRAEVVKVVEEADVDRHPGCFGGTRATVIVIEDMVRVGRDCMARQRCDCDCDCGYEYGDELDQGFPLYRDFVGETCGAGRDFDFCYGLVNPGRICGA